MESHGILTFFPKRSKPKKSLARTSSSKTKQCAPPKAGLPSEPRIHWRKRGKQRGRLFGTPTPYLLQNHLVRLWCPRRELNLHLFLRTELFYPLNYEGKEKNTKLEPKQLGYPRSVKADSQLIPYQNNRHAHLPGLFYHFSPFFNVASDIVFRISNIVRLKKLFSHLTEMTSRSRINFYIWCCIWHKKLKN